MVDNFFYLCVNALGKCSAASGKPSTGKPELRFMLSKPAFMPGNPPFVETLWTGNGYSRNLLLCITLKQPR